MAITAPAGSRTHVDGSVIDRSPDERAGEIRAAVSNGLVALLKEYYGRGPEQARTYVHDDLVICVTHGGFSRVEDTLFAAGRGDLVYAQRIAFQQVMDERFKRVVEDATGRRVAAFMSGNHLDPDMTCEVFVLEPAGASV